MRTSSDGECPNCHGKGEIETMNDWGYKPPTVERCTVCDGFGIVRTSSNTEAYNKRLMAKLSRNLKIKTRSLATYRNAMHTLRLEIGNIKTEMEAIENTK
jgi:DnaJ-class molecular chaperone